MKRRKDSQQIKKDIKLFLDKNQNVFPNTFQISIISQIINFKKHYIYISFIYYIIFIIINLQIKIQKTRRWRTEGEGEGKIRQEEIVYHK